jgi:hypothetical protein
VGCLHLFALVVKNVEVLKWLLNVKLLLSLKRAALLSVEDMHVVASLGSYSGAIFVSFVEPLIVFLDVKSVDSSVLHKLNGGWT